MATWTAVKQYLASNYHCEPFGNDALKLTFQLDNDRSQLIIVDWAGADPQTATWVDFHTPIGRLGSVDLNAAVRRTRSFVVGGLSCVDDIVTLRASLPLQNLDRNEIEEPLHLLVSVGDTFEQALTGRDEF